MPRIIPEPRYFSMPSMDVGAEVRMKRDLNCWPWVRSLTHSPDAVTHSPAAITAAWPITVINSRWPRALMRRTQKPFSALWKVTRSTRPARTSRVADSSLACGGPFTRCRAPLAPHAAQPGPDINTGHRLRRQRVGNGLGSCCGTPSEQRQDVVGQEPRARGDRVAAAEAVLVGAEEPQRLKPDGDAAWHGSWRRKAAGALPRSAPDCRWPCPRGCSHRRDSTRRPHPIPDPWQNGSSTGSDNPRRARGGRPGRRPPRAGRASLRRESVRGLGSPWRSVRAGRGLRRVRVRNRRAALDAADTTLVLGQPAQPRQSRHRVDAAACGRSPARTEPPHPRVRNQQALPGRTRARRDAPSPSLPWPARSPAAIAERINPRGRPAAFAPSAGLPAAP